MENTDYLNYADILNDTFPYILPIPSNNLYVSETIKLNMVNISFPKF